MIIYQYVYRNDNPNAIDAFSSIFLIIIPLFFIFGLAVLSLLDAFGLLDDFITIVEGLRTGWAAYTTPWKAHSFNAFFGWYFAGFTMLFLLVLTLWVLILPLRFFDIVVPFKPIFIIALILSTIPLTIWICCGLGYWYWFMPPA